MICLDINTKSIFTSHSVKYKIYIKEDLSIKIIKKMVEVDIIIPEKVSLSAK